MKKGTFHTLKDAELIELIQSGKDSSLYFEEIYHRYFQKVLDKCYSFLKNRQQAEEMTEDIFSKCYEKLPGFRGQASFSSWLYTITYNSCIDYLRHKKKSHYPEWNRENELPEIIDDVDEMANSIDYEKLQIILELIHPEEKAILLMKYMDNISLKHIGESLRISEDAAKMRLKRARTRVLALYREKYMERKL